MIEKPSKNHSPSKNQTNHSSDICLSLYGLSRVGTIDSKMKLIKETPCNCILCCKENIPLNPVTQVTITAKDTINYHRIAGAKRYELSNHLGNVIEVITDRKISNDVNNDGATDYYEPEVVGAWDYYAFGGLMPGRGYVGARYRYGFNGKEKDDEVKGNGNSLDFGARMNDPRLGRWLSVDGLASKYSGVSPFVFALNTPIQAKDPDGNVVIFINGQHAGGGGQVSYWAGYDQRAMNKIGDHSARYVDGALGGWKNTGLIAANGGFAGSHFSWVGSVVGAVLNVVTSSNVNRKVRIAAGAAQGMKDAASIIANLSDGESIKIVTHSMGTGFARGYTEGIMKYAEANGLADRVKFDYELDVNSFQGADLPASDLVKQTQSKTGGLDGGGMNLFKTKLGNSVPTVGTVPNAEDANDASDANKGHAIGEMSDTKISNIRNAGTESKRPIEQNNNNENAPR